jgi:hypothetical protein
MRSKIPRHRSSSYPFISGDSFLHLATCRILSNCSDAELEATFIELEKCTNNRKVLFVEASYFEQDRNFDNFGKLVLLCTKKLRSSTNIVIHNGDVIPNTEQFAFITQHFDSVFSVNANSELSGVVPLPIGLENRHHRRNGIGREFNIGNGNIFRVNVKKDSTNRTFSSFSLSTNFKERSELLKLLEKYGFDYVTPTLEPRSYRREVLRSQFVLSPPGNGIDCHRTWEAIYLGAIPVVLKTCLHKYLVNSFPIYPTDTWENFLQKSDSELNYIINEFDGKEFPALTMEFWETYIQNGLTK